MSPSPAFSHFESFGPVPRVIRDVESRAQTIFPDLPITFIETIKKVIEENSAENKWDMVSLTLSKGMARAVLNDMAQTPFPHKGNIIVDPTGSTPEYNIIESSQLLRVNKERLIMVNEATDDLLIIMYGTEEADRSSDFHLMQRHLRMAGLMLDMLMEEDEEAFAERDGQGLLDQRSKQLRLAREQLMHVYGSLSAKREEMLGKGNLGEATTQLLMLYRTITSLVMSPNNMIMIHVLEMLLHTVRSIPDNFTRLGFDLTPFLEADASTSISGGLVKKAHVIQPKPKQPLKPTQNGPTQEPKAPHRSFVNLGLDPE